MVIVTPRLLLRELEQSDFADLAEMLQDPDVVYAYEHRFTHEDVQAWLDRQKARYAQYGFGLWAVVNKNAGEVVGQAGLTLQPCEEEEVLEIGYLLKKRFWHQGYAREAAEGIKQYAFYTLNAPKVCSIIKTYNVPSMQVAKAIGMEKEKEFTAAYFNGGRPHFLFSVYKKEEENRSPSLLLRPYRPEDLPQIVRLFEDTIRTVNRRDYSPEQVEVWAKRGELLQNSFFTSLYTVVALFGDTVAGYGNIDSSGYLDHLYVHKDFQRRGVASALCQELERYASSQGVRRITVHASITARPFFERKGFSVQKEQQVLLEGIPLTNYEMDKIL